MPKLGPVAVSEQIRSSADIYERVLSPTVTLSWVLEDNAVVICDATQLESAVLNLIINARDAIDGRGRIEVSTRVEMIANDPELADGEYVILTATDDGCGMAPAVTQKIFEPFFSTKADKGTGLGLAQVFGFALRADGTARVRSTIGHGTTLSLYLKTTPLPGTSTVPLEDFAAARPVAPRVKVLLIEDDGNVRESLATFLDVSGFLVVPVASGFAAVQMVERYAPDIIVSDWSLPGLGGTTLAHVLGTILPNVPLIFLTGNAEINLAHDAMQDFACLQKPITGDALVEAIHKTLDG
jgi:CheY-like chemotaxis protein